METLLFSIILSSLFSTTWIHWGIFNNWFENSFRFKLIKTSSSDVVDTEYLLILKVDFESSIYLKTAFITFSFESLKLILNNELEDTLIKEVESISFKSLKICCLSS